MKKRIFASLAAAAALVCALFACGCTAAQEEAAEPVQPEAVEEQAVSEEAAAAADALRIGSLKGPTSVGLASMMEADEGVFTVAAAADEIAPKLLQDELDIVCVPANLAATLYQKTDGAIRVLDVNTLGVLYAVSAADVASVDDLRGRTVYMTGKGTVPEYTVLALLDASGIAAEEVDLQFRSEPAEVVALIAQEPEAVGILPQPYATSATMKDETLAERIDLTQAWEEATGGDRGSLITGVTIAKASTVAAEPEAIAEFLRRCAASAEVAQTDPSAIAAEVASLGIIDSEAVALAAIPRCNVVCITGQEMKEALSGYLEALFALDPTSVGGELPGDDFYLIDLDALSAPSE